MLRTPPTIARPACAPSSGGVAKSPGREGASGSPGLHRERLHLVAERVGDAAVGQDDAQPEAAALAAVDREGLAALCGVDDAVRDARAGAHLGGVDDDTRERLRLVGGVRRRGTSDREDAEAGDRERDGAAERATRDGAAHHFCAHWRMHVDDRILLRKDRRAGGSGRSGAGRSARSCSRGSSRARRPGGSPAQRCRRRSARGWSGGRRRSRPGRAARAPCRSRRRS